MNELRFGAVSVPLFNPFSLFSLRFPVSFTILGIYPCHPFIFSSSFVRCASMNCCIELGSDNVAFFSALFFFFSWLISLPYRSGLINEFSKSG